MGGLYSGGGGEGETCFVGGGARTGIDLSAAGGDTCLGGVVFRTAPKKSHIE